MLEKRNHIKTLEFLLGPLCTGDNEAQDIFIRSGHLSYKF